MCVCVCINNGHYKECLQVMKRDEKKHKINSELTKFFEIRYKTLGKKRDTCTDFAFCMERKKERLNEIKKERKKEREGRKSF